MTVFWVVAGCLIGAALLFVVAPLFQRKAGGDVERASLNVSIYRNQLQELDDDLATGDITQENYAKSRDEIERRLLEDTAMAESGARETGKELRMATGLVVALAIPLAAVLLYLDLGNPSALDPQKVAQQAASPHGNGEEMTAQIEQMVGKLAQRLQENPQDIEGWVMLGRSMSVLGRYDEAVTAYEKAINFVGEDAALLADYADALAMASGESLEGKPMELLHKALQIDPNNQKALWLAGTGLFERGDFAGAIEFWTRLLNMLPPDSEDIRVVQANIDEARSYRERQLKGEFGPAPPKADLPGGKTEAQAETTTQAGTQNNAGGNAHISGRVTLAPALQAKVKPGDTLFVYAKAVDGPPMPLAVMRSQAGELPLEFNLDQSLAAMPGMSLANFSQVTVGARISSSGNAMAQSGDLQGMTQAVAVGSEGLEIVIDSVVP